MDRRTFVKGVSLATLGAGMLPLLKSLPAQAASNRPLVVALGASINSLDIHRSGTNRTSYQIAVNCYDRLVSFGTKTLADGTVSYNYDTLVPELATEWETVEDGTSIIFHLRQEATFWDGKPVTAHDVKWSFDRAVSVGGFPTMQMKAGSLEKPEQFEAVDDHTFRIHLLHPSKLTRPDLATPVPIVINSVAAKAEATESDPWATEFLHRTALGSGAFKVQRWDVGQQLVYERNDDWKCGPLPSLERVVIRELPSTSTRRALIERGDVNVSFDIPNKDAKELDADDKVKVVSTPIENCLFVLATNLEFEPFKDKRIRQAIAYAVPYEDIFRNAAYERGVPMWGAQNSKPTDIAWPQPFPYATDLDKAKALLAETDFKDGFEVPLSFDLGQADWAEPTALLIQQNLQRIGIRTTLNKVPGANWRTVALVEKKLPLHLENFGGWLNTPDYYFYWAYLKGNLFNSSNYDNDEIRKLVEETLYMKQDDPQYRPKILRMIEIAMDDVPRIPLWQPSLNVAMRPEVQGYQYWFHRQLDIRPLSIEGRKG